MLLRHVSNVPNADVEGAAQTAKAANDGGLILSNNVLSLKWEPNIVKVSAEPFDITQLHGVNGQGRFTYLGPDVSST
jgi:hypothetical protein